MDDQVPLEKTTQDDLMPAKADAEMTDDQEMIDIDDDKSVGGDSVSTVAATEFSSSRAMEVSESEKNVVAADLDVAYDEADTPAEKDEETTAPAQASPMRMTAFSPLNTTKIVSSGGKDTSGDATPVSESPKETTTLPVPSILEVSDSPAENDAPVKKKVGRPPKSPRRSPVFLPIRPKTSGDGGAFAPLCPPFRMPMVVVSVNSEDGSSSQPTEVSGFAAGENKPKESRTGRVIKVPSAFLDKEDSPAKKRKPGRPPKSARLSLGPTGDVNEGGYGSDDGSAMIGKRQNVNPKYLLPFGEGWRREIVLRSTYDEGKTRAADVYYYAPTGRKLRSSVEIGKFLTEVGNITLTTDCFTWFKEKIHEEPAEFVRVATKSKKTSEGSSTKSPKTPVMKQKKSPFYKSPLALKKSAMGVMGQAKSPLSPPKTVPNILRIKLKNPNEIKSEPDDEVQSTSTVITASSLLKRVTSPTSSNVVIPDGQVIRIIPVPGKNVAKKHTGKRPLPRNGENPIKKFKMHSDKDGAKRMCSMECPGRHGVPPSLPCTVCMCMFHPECVNRGPHQRSDGFVCKACKKVNKTAVVTSNSDISSVNLSLPVLSSPSTTAPKSVFIGGMQTAVQGRPPKGSLVHPVGPLMRSGPPPLRRPPVLTGPSFPLPLNSQNPIPMIVNSLPSNTNLTVQGPSPIMTAPVNGPAPLSNPPPLTVAPVVVGGNPLPLQPPPLRLAPNAGVVLPTGGDLPPVAISLGVNPTINPTVDLLQSLISPVPVASAPDILVKAPTAVPKDISGQILALPSNVTSRLNLDKPVSLKVNGQSYLLPPQCLISTQEGAKIYLPSGCMPNAQGPSVPLNIGLTSKSGTGEQQLNVRPLANMKAAVGISDKADSEDVTVTRPQPTSTRSKKLACPIQQFHVGFDSMLLIFSHLRLVDILRAMQVCKTWKNVAAHPSLWRSVEFRNYYISDWEKAAKMLENMHTKSLNLKGIQHGKDSSRTWSQFTLMLPHLVYLRRLDFGQCPSSVLHATAEKLLNLRAITAEFITDASNPSQIWSANAKLDIGKFAKLKELEELKLRGLCGLVMPSFSFSGSLAELNCLTGLKVLSVTTLRDVCEEDFNFIGALTNLEELELGDLSSWKTETYAQLSSLTKLRSLRLECGFDSKEGGLGEALEKLQKLKNLELIRFAISQSLMVTLPKLTSLESLSVWPDTGHQAAYVNTCTLRAVSDMMFLQQLDWGIMIDPSSSNTNGNPSHEETSQDSSSSSSSGSVPSSKEPSRADTIAILSNSVLDDELENDHSEDVLEYIGINKVVDRLCDNLPDTKIRVFKVPVVTPRITATTSSDTT